MRIGTRFYVGITDHTTSEHTVSKLCPNSFDMVYMYKYTVY